MRVYETLCEIAQQVEIKGSCSSIVDRVEELAGLKNLSGGKYFVLPIIGKKSIQRYNLRKELVSANFHEVWIHEDSEGALFVVDVDSPEQVYRGKDHYRKECFLFPESVVLQYFEEP